MKRQKVMSQMKGTGQNHSKRANQNEDKQHA